jgi:hypothetical protein
MMMMTGSDNYINHFQMFNGQESTPYKATYSGRCQLPHLNDKQQLKAAVIDTQHNDKT